MPDVVFADSGGHALDILLHGPESAHNNCIVKSFTHVVPDDVIIADIADQARDIFLHGPESAHRNGIVKTFTHNPFPYTRAHSSKEKKKNKEQNAQFTKHDVFVYWSSSCPKWRWATARKLGTCSCPS